MIKILLKLIMVLGIHGVAAAQSESGNIPEAWQTLAEQTGYQKTWRYDETIAFAKKLDAASGLISYKTFGKSGEGRDMPLLIAAQDGAFLPSAARKQKKAVILIQAGIHSGEIDGKDAGLALLRDIAITKTKAGLLKDIVVLFIPIYNVDGHEIFSPFNRINQNGPDEMGWRATSAGLNLNRDYMKADAPETRAFLKLWNEWKPDFFIDSHVTDGADYRYNVTYEFAHHEEVSPFIKNWMNERFEKRVVPEIEKEGNLLAHYLEFAGREVKDGIEAFIPAPRFATGYAPLRNRPGLLLETHSLKPYRSRVRGTYDTFWKTLKEIGFSKESLLEANRRADEETIIRGRSYDSAKRFPLRQELTKKSEPFLFKGVEYSFEDSPISGGKKIVYGSKPMDIVVPRYDEANVSVAVAPPLGYILPPQWQMAIGVLASHGIEYRRLKKAVEIEVEGYRLSEPKWAATSFEGRLALSFKANMIKELRRFPENSVVVFLDQETANVAIHLFEPLSPDSFASWGFFNSIFEQKEYFSDYIMEQKAAEMLAGDASLRREFEERLKDEKFAKSPRARLQFFYERSPYSDKRIGIYPAGRLTKNLEAAILR